MDEKELDQLKCLLLHPERETLETNFPHAAATEAAPQWSKLRRAVQRALLNAKCLSELPGVALAYLCMNTLQRLQSEGPIKTKSLIKLMLHDYGDFKLCPNKEDKTCINSLLYRVLLKHNWVAVTRDEKNIARFESTLPAVQTNQQKKRHASESPERKIDGDCKPPHNTE